jgi:hypothetical protein
MSTPARLIRRLRQTRQHLSNRADVHFRKSRPGSVLILVVALLVLLALMGTAYISTSQIDRSSTAQNSFNTEIDLLIDAVCKIEQQQILTSPDAPTAAFDQSAPPVPPDAMIWTSPQAASGMVSSFLASRIPILNSNGSPIWPFLSVAPWSAGFESPYVPTETTGPLTYNTSINLQPTSISIPTPSGTSIYPALTDGNPNHIYLAASASGSGIADAGLFRLPLGELNGVTYYGSAFTIDNCAAVNASIANAPNTTLSYQQGSPLPGDFFPTSINLSGMLLGTASGQLSQLNAYRWGGAATASLTPVYDDGSPMGLTMSFMFSSPLEAMWMQLGRRLDNPGLNTSGIYYQTLPIAESMTMAYRHCLMNPAASPSLLEQYLGPSVTFTGSGAAVRTSAYSPDQVQQWFNDNFTYDSTGGNSSGNIRPLLVARNQVSNVSGSRFTYRANSASNPPTNTWQLSTSQTPVSYKFGDWVTGASGSSGHTYVCIQDNTSATTNSPTNTSEQFWTQEPWTDYPVKTSVNTGTFGQLWLGYWSVMSDLGADEADASSKAAMFRNPIRGHVSVTAAGSGTNSPTSGGSGNTLTVSPSGGDDTSNIQSVVDRSAPGDTVAFSAGTYSVSASVVLLPGRTYSGGGTPGVSGIAQLSPEQTLRLRAAIAAINTQQLRSDNSQILGRQIALSGTVAPTSTGTNVGGAVISASGGLVSSAQGTFVCGGGSGTTVITGFTFTGNFISVANSSYNVYNNSFIGSPGNGIFDVAVTNSHFNQNTFSNIGAVGIYGYPGNNNTFDTNTFTHCWESIHQVATCDQTDVSGNVILQGCRIGIELQNPMSNLTVENNYLGEWLPEPDPGANPGSQLAISIATNQANNVTASGNLIIHNADNGSNYSGVGYALEIAGTNVTVTNNVSWGWGTFILNAIAGPSTVSGNKVYGGSEWAWDGGSGYVAPNDSDGPILPLSALSPLPGPPSAGATPTTQSSSQPATTSLSFRVTLYGTGQQPYITEVYANNDQSTGGGFLAVSLYNPYSTPINLSNWQWITVNRSAGVSQLVLSALSANTNDSNGWGISTLAPYQRVVFANKAKGNMPQGISIDPGATFISLPALSGAFNYELMLVRPHHADGSLGFSSAANNQYDETGLHPGLNTSANPLADYVPVDCYDFTGLPTQPSADDSDSAEWHYIRPSDQATHNWYFVYPYTYDPTTSDNTSTNLPTGSNQNEPIPTSRLFATLVKSGATPTPTALGFANPAPADSTYASKGFPIQVNNTDFGGPKEPGAVSQFPFGGFARNGDILQTTFIGAYRIDEVSLLADGTVDPNVQAKTVEYQPVTMDAAFADDLNDGDNQAENVGRFCPLNSADCNGQFNDLDPIGPASAYHFATRLYDFLTVGGPADDYMQSIRPGDASPLPYPIANVKPTVKNAYFDPSMATTEDAAPTDGLININTAPWRVLATLPMASNAADNITLAKAIVQYRDVDNGTTAHVPHGPFKSILELNGVPNFRNTLLSSTSVGAFNPKGPDAGPTDGDLAPLSSTTPYDQVPGDFEKQFLAFNRISNLVTVRSDSFTTYVLVQGWRHAGTAAPELVVQRHAAFISDRSGSIPSNRVLNITNIPTQ